MIKTILKHYILDKFIAKIFDDFTEKILIQHREYSATDFYVGQKIAYIEYTNITSINPIKYTRNTQLYDNTVHEISRDLIYVHTNTIIYHDCMIYDGDECNSNKFNPVFIVIKGITKVEF